MLELLTHQDYFADGFDDMVEAMIMKRAFLEKTVYYKSLGSFLIKKDKLEEFQSLILSKFSEEDLLSQCLERNESVINKTFMSHKSFISFRIDVNGDLYFTAFSYDKEFINSINEFVRKNKTIQNEKGSVYVLMNQDGRLTPYIIGSDYHEIERGNYAQDVLNAYDKTVEEFSKKNGNGFISIFSGPAGTGKTMLIRSLIGNIKNSIFLYVPADLIREFAGPSLIGVFHSLSLQLRDEEDEDEEKKMILILEDADQVLAPRQETDMQGISTLLNVTDGILGKIFNIRILATTNSPAKSLDSAITRPGRLCVHSVVSPLDFNHASSIYTRIEGKGSLEERNYTLAEIYALARGEKLPSQQEFKRNKYGF